MLNQTPTAESRTRSQRNCDRMTALGRVFRMAKVLESGMHVVQRGVYRIEPGDVLALRVALAEAAMVIEREERSRT